MKNTCSFDKSIKPETTEEIDAPLDDGLGSSDKRTKPEITEEIDAPLDDDLDSAEQNVLKQHVLEQIKLNDQQHSHSVENYKNKVGGILLIFCLVIIAVFAIADAIFGVDSSLFSGAFEFAKTIATAVIGYFFATSSKNK